MRGSKSFEGASARHCNHLPNSNLTMETAAVPPPTSLLDLPDRALLTVLRCLAGDRDLTSLFSAARAHSTLHQLSAAALSSIAVTNPHQQQVAGVLSYLRHHPEHVDSLYLQYDRIASLLLDELPSNLQLTSLSFLGMQLQLQLQLLPGGGRAGVLQAGAPLKRLEMCYCRLCNHALAEALSHLPELEHFVYWGLNTPFKGHVLSNLQQLTFLDVMYAPADLLEFVHLAPGLRNLRASYVSDGTTGSKLSALEQLTSLQLVNLSSDFRFDPADLANKHNLGHLHLICCGLTGGPAAVAALLSQLQQMTQLTHLALPGCWRVPDDAVAASHPHVPPAAAYAALTASSMLQHLDVSFNAMPQGVWQHVLPADRQLLQLRVLNASNCGAGCWTHADIARLVTCCPNLQELNVRTDAPTAQHVLQPLHSLRQLTALEIGKFDGAAYSAAAVLTKLSELTVRVDEDGAHAGLLPLTRLQRLTKLYVVCDGEGHSMFVAEEPEDQPVWQQALNFCMRLQQPGVGEPGAGELAQQVAASLEELAL